MPHTTRAAQNSMGSMGEPSQHSASGAPSPPQERCPLRYDSRKADCVSCMKNVQFFSDYPATCYEFANYVSLRVKNNTESESCKAGARSPWHSHGLPTLPEQLHLDPNPKDSTPERKDFEEAPRANQSIWGDEGEETRQVQVPSCSVIPACKLKEIHSSRLPAAPCSLASRYSGAALLCALHRSANPYLKQLSTMKYNFKFYLLLTLSYY